mmetsp:Transcript_1908/g.2677  ORF Transcript_1908/g.2677 Transcript_1908/m.2677 type:complete len:160 (-) Transcript_1908:708-1187(-)
MTSLVNIKCTTSREQLAEFREMFNLADKDKNGSISKEQLGDLLRTIGINASEEEISMMVGEIDDDINGRIGFDEFAAAMSKRICPNYSITQVNDAFRMFQEETEAPQGHITYDDLVKALTENGTKRLTEERAKELVQQLGPDQDGLINYVEFIDLMMRW